VIPYEEVVEEALCVGRIDGLGNPLDDERHLLLITPCTRGSGWSRRNKQRPRKAPGPGSA
jgi:hypothetical protein